MKCKSVIYNSIKNIKYLGITLGKDDNNFKTLLSKFENGLNKWISISCSGFLKLIYIDSMQFSQKPINFFV